MYAELRQSFGPFAQGPAAVVARLGNQAVFSVDALGLRPLWYGETEKEHFITSERGVYALDSMSVSPKPMAPGEKIAMTVNNGQDIQVLGLSGDSAIRIQQISQSQAFRAGGWGHLGFGRKRRRFNAGRTTTSHPSHDQRRGAPCPDAVGASRCARTRSRASQNAHKAAMVRLANKSECGCHGGLWLGTLSRRDCLGAFAERQRADRLARLGWSLGGAQQYARESRRLLQGNDCGRHESVDRSRTRASAVFLASADRLVGRRSRRDAKKTRR